MDRAQPVGSGGGGRKEGDEVEKEGGIEREMRKRSKKTRTTRRTTMRREEKGKEEEDEGEKEKEDEKRLGQRRTIRRTSHVFAPGRSGHYFLHGFKSWATSRPAQRVAH